MNYINHVVVVIGVIVFIDVAVGVVVFCCCGSGCCCFCSLVVDVVVFVVDAKQHSH